MCCPQCGSAKRKLRVRKGGNTARNLYRCHLCATNYNTLTATRITAAIQKEQKPGSVADNKTQCAAI
ncbi:hypothetical protein [Paraburkholderia piptadeniae]|uniref:hypothetical protein n=1 Tax=Paraburkholderia piptadeniae TaxID=1701573 RepID=UPI003F6A4D84